MFPELAGDSGKGTSFSVPFASSKPDVPVQSPLLLLLCSFVHRLTGSSLGPLPGDA